MSELARRKWWWTMPAGNKRKREMCLLPQYSRERERDEVKTGAVRVWLEVSRTKTSTLFLLPSMHKTRTFFISSYIKTNFGLISTLRPLFHNIMTI